MYLDDLPYDTHDKVGTTLNQILWANVDNVATNGLGGVDAENLVFSNAEGIELGLVDHTFVDGVWDCIVDQLAV